MTLHRSPGAKRRILLQQTLLLLLCSSYCTLAIFPPFVHFYMDDAKGPLPSTKEPDVLSASHTPNDCFISVQVTKKVAGHCVTLGRETKGCVAGALLHPFHPDC